MRPIISITTTAKTWAWLTPLLLTAAALGSVVLHRELTKPAPAPVAHGCKDSIVQPNDGQVVTCDTDQRLIQAPGSYHPPIMCVCNAHLQPLLTQENAIRLLGPGKIERDHLGLWFWRDTSDGRVMLLHVDDRDGPDMVFCDGDHVCRHSGRIGIQYQTASECLAGCK